MTNKQMIILFLVFTIVGGLGSVFPYPIPEKDAPCSQACQCKPKNGYNGNLHRCELHIHCSFEDFREYIESHSQNDKNNPLAKIQSK